MAGPIVVGRRIEPDLEDGCETHLLADRLADIRRDALFRSELDRVPYGAGLEIYRPGNVHDNSSAFGRLHAHRWTLLFAWSVSTIRQGQTALGRRVVGLSRLLLVCVCSARCRLGRARSHRCGSGHYVRDRLPGGREIQARAMDRTGTGRVRLSLSDPAGHRCA